MTTEKYRKFKPATFLKITGQSDENLAEYPYGKAILILAILFYAFCSYMIMLFGIKFSGQKASYWLLSSCISTMTDVIVMQPVQIIVKTLLT